MVAACHSASEALRNGSWQSSNATRASSSTAHHRTAALDAAGCAQADRWDWMPSVCRLNRLAYRAYCGRHIAFIGDSLSSQSFNSLTIMLKARPGFLCRATTSALGSHVTCAVASSAGQAPWCTITTSHVVSHFLCHDGCERAEYSEGAGRHQASSTPLSALLQSQQSPSFVGADLVFATGLHWTTNHANMDIGAAAVHALLRANLRACIALAAQLNASSSHFRTLWPGHQHCTSHVNHGPVAAEIPYVENNPYRWHEVLALNQIVADECSAAPKCIYHDLRSMSALRPDAHMHWQPTNPGVDCAHWCLLGGPMEWSNVVLQAQLAGLARHP